MGCFEEISRDKECDSLKIAMIGHKRVPSRSGGIEVVVGELSRRMSARGHQVTIYNRRVHEPRERSWQGCRIVEVRTFANEKLNAFVYSFFATLRAIAGGYDVLHFHAEGPSCMIFLAKLFGKRCVSTIHGLDWQRAKWGRFASTYLMLGEKQAGTRADQVIVLSRAAQQYFRETYGRETVLLPNGIDRPERRDPDLIARKHGLGKGDYLLFLARITPEKGLHHLLEAYAGLDTDLPLVVAGSLEPETEYIARIRELAARDPRVRLVGFVQGTELEELYSNCRMYILPSNVEGMAMSLLEAVSYGAPCLASDIPENREAAGECARYFPVSDPAAMGETLKRALEEEDFWPDPVQRQEALEHFFQCHDWEEITERTLELYRRVSKKMQ